MFYLYCFVLEHVTLCGFGWVHYGRNKRKIQSTTLQIGDYKFNKESKSIYEGASFRTILGDVEWQQRCKILLHTFFSKATQLSEIITFPDTKLSIQGKPWEGIKNTLQCWCANSNPSNEGDAAGLIIRNYDLKNHLKFCGITDDEIKNFSTFQNFEKKMKTTENNQRFLVFKPSEKIILIIRMSESKHHGQLKAEVYHCMDEVILLSFLLKHELKESGVIVTGLVVYEGEKDLRQTGCTDCDNFVVSSEIFNSGHHFDNFWKRFVSQNVFATFASKLEARQKSDNVTLFEAVASKIVGYLAHLQFEISDKPVLPVPEKEPVRNIKQAELLLNRYQMEIAYYDEKHILLTGNYGTGKTVVALKKLELLYQGLKEKEVIYYVNFAGKSQLHLQVMEKNKTKEKVKVITGGTSLSNIINFKILPEEKRNNTENVNLIVDEYDSQDLSEKESENLYDILTNEEQFKHSTVLIAVQPLEIDRTDYFITAGKEKEYRQARHMFGKLKEIMEVFKLKYVMRTTVEINNLIEITQSYLNNKTNRYKGERRNYSEEMEKSAARELFPKLGQESSKANNKTENKPQISDQNLSAKPNNPDNIVSGFQSASSNHASLVHSKEIIDHDELYKLTSTSSKKNKINLPKLREKRNLQKVISKYRYTCDSVIGHSINGPLPKLIKLPKASDPCEQIVLTAFLLLEIINIKSKRICIIHFDKTDPLWFQLLFKGTNFFAGVTVTNNVGEFLRNLGNMVLVSNYNCVTGLEFSEVLLMLDADEYHLKQFIPEAMARCMNNLTILVRPKHKGNLESDTVTNLADHWQVFNETGKPVMEILSLKVCSSHTFKKHENYKETHCKTKKSKYTSYKMHKRCERYKDLSKIIQLSYRTLHSEEKKISKEAEAM